MVGLSTASPGRFDAAPFIVSSSGYDVVSKSFSTPLMIGEQPVRCTSLLVPPPADYKDLGR
jgi:hypothetical protein